MGKSLVIVESPTKAKTIAQFIGNDYVVESSIGHIRDLPGSAAEIPASHKGLPWARLGIDVENGFQPLYIVPSDKKKQVTRLKELLKDADRLYLATDEDREGESISWHLMEVLKPKVPTHRLVFHEITKEAIHAALASPRDIDQRLVQAQETRRVLDRLYGYEVSPVLWRKIAPKLSAGRVQSVAVRVTVLRERERIAFHASEYWDLEGHFRSSAGEPFDATLISVAGQRVAAGRDFDPATGKLAEGRKDVVHLRGEQAAALSSKLEAAAWQVLQVEQKPYRNRPPAPFTTSTLQQEGGRKLGLSARETMRLAQSLYEQGYITYMRTDSTTLSDQALKAARAQIRERYGADYLPDQPRVYASKVKNAQEAHEAIRPAGETFRLPEEVRGKLQAKEWGLYDLIWKRTVAGQMPDAQGQRQTVQVGADDALFQATGRTIDFPGFLRAYVEGSDDPGAELGDKERILPNMQTGQALTCDQLTAEEHITQPPARFTEASLIKELEKEGIGRPSTYASIIDTIIRRQYVSLKGKALVPSFTAFAVVRLLEEYFTHLVDLDFTAQMENVLDAISRGESEALPYLQRFYQGREDLPGLQQLLGAEIDARKACTIPLQQDRQAPINIRIGKYGPYLERDSERASLPADISPDELTPERARELLEKGATPDILGTHPETGQNVYLKVGRYGPYVQLGEAQIEGKERPKMKSLLPGQEPEWLTLDDALHLLTLPRNLGRHEATGEDVEVDLGRYGPYARRGKESRSLASAEELFTLTLEQSEALFLQPPGRRRGPAELRALGKHPTSGEDVRLMDGRFGPYVTDGTLNASIPRAADPATVTLEEALVLLQARAERGPAKGGRRKAAPKKAAAKKTAAKKKAAPKKAAPKKSAAAKKAVPKAAAAKTSTAKTGTLRKRKAEAT